METVIDQDIAKLRKKLARISQNIYKLHKLSYDSIENHDSVIALGVIVDSEDINQLFDNLLMDATVLLTKNPLAIQLRQVMSLLSITKDLKFFSKLSVDIAKYQIKLTKSKEKYESNFLKKSHTNFNKVLKRLFAFLQEKKPYDQINNLQERLKKLSDNNHKTLTEMRKLIINNKDKEKSDLLHLFFEFELVALINQNKAKIREVCEAILYINEGHLVHL